VHDSVTPFARLPYVVLISVLLIVGCWPNPILRLIDSGSRPLIERSITPPPGRLAQSPVMR